MIVRAQDLPYPLLCLTRQVGVCVVQSAADLERCRAAVYWRGKLFQDLRLVDANGDAYVVVRTIIRKPRSTAGRALARLLDLPLRIDVETTRTTPVSLAEARDLVEKAVEEDSEAFEEFSGKDVAWWRSALAKCATIAELLRTFQAPKA